MQCLIYLGGALNQSAGEHATATGILIFSGIGLSECGALTQVQSIDHRLHPS